MLQKITFLIKLTQIKINVFYLLLSLFLLEQNPGPEKRKIIKITIKEVVSKITVTSVELKTWNYN